MQERRALLRWYEHHARDLPWRRTRDPYAIWISESMLQQTRVETVIPYYHRFLSRFPDVATLADADPDEVMAVWSGLGYYRRARHLQAAARALVERHAGRLPEDPAALRALPGVGRYTAGAVASIAFDRPEPVLDGNVARVLARLRGMEEPVDTAAGRRRLWEEAAALARGPRPGDLNQALMELGATVCTPAAPACPRCPLARGCRARAAGRVEELPRRTPRRPPRAVEAVAALVRRGARVLAVRRPERGILGGLWDLPGGPLRRGEEPALALRRRIREGLALELRRVEEAGSVAHVFTHQRLRLRLFRAEAAPGRVRRLGYASHRWLPPAALARLPSGALLRRALAALDLPVDTPWATKSDREAERAGRSGRTTGSARRPSETRTARRASPS